MRKLSFKTKKIMWAIGFVPEKIGSYEELMFLMTEQAINKGFKISFVFPAEPIRNFKEKILSLGAQVFIIPMRKRIDVGAIMQLSALIKKEKPTVLHSNFDLANFTSCFAVLFAKTPVYIWHQHNFMSNRFRLIRKLFFKFLSLVADKIIILSEAMKKDFILKGLKKSKIERIYNGIKIDKFNIDPQQFESDLRNEFNILPNSIVLTCVGDARPEKGQIFLIKAFFKIVKEYPQSNLLLIGGKTGPCYNELKEWVKKLSLVSRVVFTEMRSDIPQILHISDIAIVPPTMEVSLYSIMEAMASFKPVIASRIGGIPEVVVDGETGIMTAPCNIEALSEAIVYLISNPLAKEKMGRAGRRIVEEKFDIKRNVKQLLALYEQIMQNKGLMPK